MKDANNVTVPVTAETGETINLSVPTDVMTVLSEIQDGTTKVEDYHKRLTGFTEAELSAAFDLVSNKDDWRDRIESLCTTDEVKVVAAAVEFYTSTKAKFDYIGIFGTTVYGDNVSLPGCRFRVGDHIMRVLADGYRAGPAA